MKFSSVLQFGRPNVPVFLQSEASECGLVCLAMIACWHGHRMDLATLRERFPLSLKGMNILQLGKIAEEINLSARALRLDLAELTALKLPCVLHWNMDHFVVLTKVNSNSITIHDPAIGSRRIQLAEVSRNFTGIAVELQPTADFVRSGEVKRVPLRAVIGKIKGLSGALTYIFLMAIALEAFAIAGPKFNQWVIDEALVSSDTELLNTLTVGLALMLIIQASLSFARGWTVMYFSTHIGLQWSANVFGHLLRLPMSWFEKRHLGDIASRFSSMESIQQVLSIGFIEALIDGVLGISTFFMMFSYSTRLSVIVVAALVIYTLLRIVFYGPLREATEETLLLASKEHTCFLETLRGMQAIKIFGKEFDRKSRWLNVVIDVTNRQIRTAKILLWFGVANVAVVSMESLLVIRFGGEMVMTGSLTIGALFAFNAYAMQFGGRVSSLVDRAVEFRMLKVHVERISDIVMATPEPVDSAWGEPSVLTPSIEVLNLGFRYSECEPWVLRNVNLQICPGESVALVGPSGCGKTTLVKLLLGLLQPTEGEIRYGGVPVSQLGCHAYRTMLAAVMQDDQLLAGSLADNISFFDMKPSRDRIVQCARLAAIDAEVGRMPMGYQTRVGDMGSALSGGQKQRILLARALYKEPKVLVLDEATSHLDVAAERAVNRAVDSLAVTRICVAHRPETIAMCGRVIELAEGRVRQGLLSHDG